LAGSIAQIRTTGTIPNTVPIGKTGRVGSCRSFDGRRIALGNQPCGSRRRYYRYWLNNRYSRLNPTQLCGRWQTICTALFPGEPACGPGQCIQILSHESAGWFNGSTRQCRAPIVRLVNSHGHETCFDRTTTACDATTMGILRVAGKSEFRSRFE